MIHPHSCGMSGCDSSISIVFNALDIDSLSNSPSLYGHSRTQFLWPLIHHFLFHTPPHDSDATQARRTGHDSPSNGVFHQIYISLGYHSSSSFASLFDPSRVIHLFTHLIRSFPQSTFSRTCRQVKLLAALLNLHWPSLSPTAEGRGHCWINIDVGERLDALIWCCQFDNM